MLLIVLFSVNLYIIIYLRNSTLPWILENIELMDHVMTDTTKNNPLHYQRCNRKVLSTSYKKK